MDKNQLAQLEQLEKLVTRLVDNDVSPFDAVADAKERLMIDVASQYGRAN